MKTLDIITEYKKLDAKATEIAACYARILYMLSQDLRKRSLDKNDLFYAIDIIPDHLYYLDEATEASINIENIGSDLATFDAQWDYYDGDYHTCYESFDIELLDMTVEQYRPILVTKAENLLQTLYQLCNQHVKKIQDKKIENDLKMLATLKEQYER